MLGLILDRYPQIKRNTLCKHGSGAGVCWSVSHIGARGCASGSGWRGVGLRGRANGGSVHGSASSISVSGVGVNSVGLHGVGVHGIVPS